jgi:hypothetical protein
MNMKEFHGARNKQDLFGAHVRLVLHMQLLSPRGELWPVCLSIKGLWVCWAIDRLIMMIMDGRYPRIYSDMPLPSSGDIHRLLMIFKSTRVYGA